MSNTIALMLQTCPRDIAEAEQLVTICAAIEKRPRNDVEFILAVRKDVDMDHAKVVVAIAKQAYPNAQLLESRRSGLGWPAGCNDLWQDCMMQLGELRLYGALKCNGVLTFEPDCQPLRPDWIDALKAEWATALDEGKLCMGSRYPDDSELPHINGNMILVPEIMRVNTKLCMSYKAWDTEHRHYFMSVGKHTDLIAQRYQKDHEVKDYHKYIRAIMESKERPALLHGLKDPAAMQAVKDMIENGEFWNAGEDTACVAT